MVLRFLKLARFQNDNLVRVIRKTGLERLKQGLLRSSDLVSLLSVFDLCGWNEELKAEVEELLMLHVQDFDAILIKQCAQSHLMIYCENHQILDKFSDRVLTKLPDLLNAISCLMNVLTFYSKARYQNPVFHSHLSQFLLKEMQSNQITYQPSHLAVIFKYILGCLSQKRELPTVLMSIVSNVLSQFAFTDVTSIARALNLKTADVPSTRFSQNLCIYKSLQQSTLQRLSEVPNINTLCMLIKVFSAKSGFGCRFEYAEITKAFEALISTVDDNSFNSVLLILKKLKLFIPDVLEYLAQFCLKNHSLEMISFMLQICVFFNFNSEKSCLLAEECLKMLEISSTLNLIEVLHIVYSLTVFEIFPKEVIKKIFSVDFLKRLDNFCETHSGLKFRLYEELEFLNRIVALECPELDIPWFHERFCQEMNIIKGPKITTERKENVLKILPDVLGGQEFYRSNQITPYFYNIDFECALTPAGQPVSFQDLTSHSHLLTSLKRVALVILEPHHYCSNVHWKLGKTAVMLRHLEMLGYTVVELPYMELDSVSQSHSDLLANYLRTKIFQGM
ncbi:uncharacterized protein LOC143246562 [Tachypleus tridentatus]|uniref:uncharacterized protein LOC143246562 n=1 Tax=Tachypleus tridentatus TaxID=6853 RepID=UPI003FD36771